MDSGQHLMERFREHAASHPTVELKRTTVTKIRKEGDLFVVETKRRGDFKAHSVVLDLSLIHISPAGARSSPWPRPQPARPPRL